MVPHQLQGACRSPVCRLRDRRPPTWHSDGMKAFTVAAVQIAPLPGPLTAESVKGNVAKAADWVTRCAEATGAELVVLPESVTTGFTPGIGPEELWDLVSDVPGPVVEPLQETARRLGVHVVVGTYERGPERGVVHNASVLLGRGGEVLGTYRKTHPFCTEMRSRGGWVTPGDEVSVVETDLGRHRADHLLRRRLPRALPDHRGARSRGHRPPLGAAAVGRHLGADQQGARLRQPCLRGRRQRHRRRPGRCPLLRQLDGGHAGSRGGGPGRQPRVLGLGPARPGEGDGVAHPGLERPAGLRPPRRPQPRPDHPVRRRPGPAGGDVLPACRAARRAESTSTGCVGRRPHRSNDLHARRQSRGSGSASTPAAPSPTSWRSTTAPGRWSPPRPRRRRPTPPTAS